MNAEDDIDPGHGGDDLVAAEYVLGVLPDDERQVVSARLDTDAAFARVVDRWEVYFAPMGAGYADVEVPDGVKASIERRLFTPSPMSTQAASVTERGGLWASLAFWRGLTFAAVAGLAIAVALPLVNPPPAPQPEQRLVASLAADGSNVHYLVVYDAAEGEVALSHVSGERAPQHDFELWMIDGDNPPVSMGVIPVGAATHVPVPPAARGKLASGAVFAVSLEPMGGSPTGLPTGPVVAAGDLKTI